MSGREYLQSQPPIPPRPAPPRPPPQSSPSQRGAARLPKTEIALYSQDSNSRNQGCRYTSRKNNYHQLKAISLLANPSLPMIASQHPAARHMSWCAAAVPRTLSGW